MAPGAVGHAAYDSILRQLSTAEVGVIGPGLGRDSSTWRLVQDLALRATCPLVIDADGLNALADSPRSKGKLGKNRVLTPHPGELARLTGKTIDAIAAQVDPARLAAALRSFDALQRSARRMAPIESGHPKPRAFATLARKNAWERKEETRLARRAQTTASGKR